MSWGKVKLGDVCTIEKGKIGITKAVPGDFPLVVLSEKRRSHNEFHFDGRAVIIPLVSSTGHGHRSLNRIHYEEGKFAVGDILCVVMPKNPNELDSSFLYHYLDLNKEKELVGRMKGMANVSLPIKSLSEIEIPLPSLHEQKTVVKKLLTINNQTAPLTTELTHQLDLVKQLRQSFLREAMQGKLVEQDPKDEPSSDLFKKIKAALRRTQGDRKNKKQKELPLIKEDELPFEIPGNWMWCRLGEIGICQTGTTPSTVVKEHFGKDIPFIKPADITLNGLIYDNEGLSYSGLKEGVLVPKGSLLMVCIGGSIGKSYYNEIDVSCNQQINTITPSAGINSKFLQYLLQSNYFQQAIWAKASGGTTPIVNRSKWESIFIPLPPLPEQHRIVGKLEQLMQLCDDLEQSIQQSKEQTTMLLQAALREALQPKAKATCGVRHQN